MSNNLTNSYEENIIDAALPSQTLTATQPMHITSDADFETYGWTGDGSLGTPYTINGLEFTSLLDGACITIENTRSHFIITNCEFSAGEIGYAIYLSNVTNGLIEFCSTGTNANCIKGVDTSNMLLNSLTLPGTCIFFEQSWQVEIAHSTISSAPGDGVYFDDCSQMTVNDVTISNCAASGICFQNTGTSHIWKNTVHDNSIEQIYIYGTSSWNYIYDNVIYVGSSGARDEGSNNQWDYGNTGNWWSNYEPPGVYNIPGSAGSVDRYPRGPSISTPTSTTSTSTATNTTSSTTTTTSTNIETVLVTNWTPIDYPIRVALALGIGIAYGTLVMLILLFFKRK
jgi:hypothetical protein